MFLYLEQVLKINNEYSKCTTSGPANQSKRYHPTESSGCNQLIFLKFSRSKKKNTKTKLLLYFLPDINFCLLSNPDV